MTLSDLFRPQIKFREYRSMARGGPKPVDVLLAELEFLSDYLKEIAAGFRSEGRTEDAELAEGWASLPAEAAEKIGDLLSR
jgi:hypothetical protein